MDFSKEIWHCELYKLQQQAPAPLIVKCNRKLDKRPIQYGEEYYGKIDRIEADEILSKYRNGAFLIRDSQRNPGAFTLVIRFDRSCKNYLLYYNLETKQHFVGSKYFDSILDLVQDGLIHMYIESRGAEILRKIAEAQVYEATPFYQSRFYTIQHEKLQHEQSKNYQRIDPSDLYNQTCVKNKHLINRIPQNIEDFNGSCDSGIFNSLRSDECILEKGDSSNEPSPQMSTKTIYDNSEDPPVAPPRRKSLYYSLRQKNNQRPSLILESPSSNNSTLSSQMTTGSHYEQIFDCRNNLLDDSMSISVFDSTELPNNNKDLSQTSPGSDRKSSNRSGLSRILSQRTPVIEQQNSFKQLEKSHNFKQHTFVGPQWCDFCAHFMWGLVAQGVQCFDCGFQAHKKCSDKVAADCFPVMKRMKRVFGIELTSLAKMENRAIPLVFDKLISALESRDLNSQGLYRISGNIDLIEEVRIDLNKDIESVDFKGDPRFKDIETITGLIKLFLRQLPIPLITSELYTNLISIRKAEEKIPIRYYQFRNTMSILNSVHYATLEFFIRHLNKVSQFHRTNFMTSSNLAIIFAPTLICKPNTSDTDLSPEMLIFRMQSDFKWDCTIIQDLIDGCDWIFSNIEKNES